MFIPSSSNISRPSTAYPCFDDPGSSDFVSKQVAVHFDAAFVANIAFLEQYRSGGAPTSPSCLITENRDAEVFLATVVVLMAELPLHGP